MTIEQTVHLEETVLLAARNLAAHQHNIVLSDRKYRQAFQVRQDAETVLRDAKSALRNVELRHARSLCEFLEAEDIERETSKRRRDLEDEHYQALKLLMKVCSTGDRTTILSAAHQFASTNSAINEAAHQDAEACFSRAKAQIAKQKVAEELQAARQNLEDAEAAVAEAKAAEQLYWSLIPRLPRSHCNFQNAVADAAAALTGAAMRESFTPFDPSDLGIEPPVDSLAEATAVPVPETTAPGSEFVPPAPPPSVSQQATSSASVSAGFEAPTGQYVHNYGMDRDDTLND